MNDDNQKNKKQTPPLKGEEITPMPALDLNQEIELLKQELERCKKEAVDNKNKYLRALADYQNFEKRVRNEQEEMVPTAKSQVLRRLLPFLDDLNKADFFIKDRGLKLIRETYYHTLHELGLEEIDILRKEFDPHLAEAVEVVEGEKDNIVIEVVRKGYKFHDKVLRVAQVKVSRKK